MSEKSTMQKTSKKYKIYNKENKHKKERSKSNTKDYEAGGFDQKGKSSQYIASIAQSKLKGQRKSQEPMLNEGTIEITMPIPFKMIRAINLHPTDIEK